MSKKLGDGRVIRKGSGTPFSSPRPPSLALLVEQREQEQVGEHSEKPCHLFATPFLPRMERAKKQPGQLLVRSSSSFIFARFLDPPATKSQLIYNDPIFTLPLPRRRFTVPVRPSLFIDPRRERKRRGEKKESSFSPPRIIRYLFRKNRSRAVSYPVHPPPFFFHRATTTRVRVHGLPVFKTAAIYLEGSNDK